MQDMPTPDIPTHAMPAERAVAILSTLEQSGVDVCVGGGWGVDALLRDQTREHSDLDVWVPAADLDPLIRALVSMGIERLFPWPGDRPWNFVVHDGRQTRVDLHLYEPIGAETFHYGSITGDERYPLAALNGTGCIAGSPVRCEAPQWAVRWHSGYPPRTHDRHDVSALCERFELELPGEYR